MSHFRCFGVTATATFHNLVLALNVGLYISTSSDLQLLLRSTYIKSDDSWHTCPTDRAADLVSDAVVDGPCIEIRSDFEKYDRVDGGLHLIALNRLSLSI